MLLDEYEKSGCPMSEAEFSLLLGEIIEGGADTSASALATLILTFAKYPEIQRKAQAQIDQVCGTERSPQWTDFDQLTYINAIVKEGMRWRPVYGTLRCFMTMLTCTVPPQHCHIESQKVSLEVMYTLFMLTPNPCR